VAISGSSWKTCRGNPIAFSTSIWLVACRDVPTAVAGHAAGKAGRARPRQTVGERPGPFANCARRFASRRFRSPRSVPMKRRVAALAAHGPWPSHHLIAAGANGYEPASAVPALDTVCGGRCRAAQQDERLRAQGNRPST
jgi:hypothetical protein